MELNENSLLATMNPLLLCGVIIVVLLLGYLCAWRYRNTNDFAKSVRLYIPLIVVTDIIMVIMGIPLILIIGMDIMGFVAMALISNHFF